MKIKITRQEQASILTALRSAQDAVRDVYSDARTRSGGDNPTDPVLNGLYGTRDSLIELERSIQGIEAE